MVPVPEELVEEVKDYLAWQVAAPTVTENPEAVAAVLANADDQLRALIIATAEATADEIRPSLREVATQSGLSMREVIGSIVDVNARLQVEGREGPLIMMRPDPRPRPDDIPEWEHRIIHMLKADADSVLA